MKTITLYLSFCFVMLYGKTDNILDVLTIPKELQDCNTTHTENYSKELNISLGCFAQDKIINSDFNEDGVTDNIFLFHVVPNLNNDQDLMPFQRYRLILFKISSTEGNYNYIKLKNSFAPYDKEYQDYTFDINAAKNEFIVLVTGGSGYLQFNYSFIFNKYLMLYKIHYFVSYSRINPEKCHVDKTISIDPKSIQNLELLKYMNIYNNSLPKECYILTDLHRVNGEEER